MAAKRRSSRGASNRAGDDEWVDAARGALRDAIGDKAVLVLVDSIDGAPPRVVVSLAIAAPPDLVPALRAHALFRDAVADVRTALAGALAGCEIALYLVPAAIETTPPMLGLALDAAGRRDVAEELGLPPSSEPASDGEEGQSFEVTRLRIRQIEATALRRLEVVSGRALPCEGEPLGPEDRIPSASPEAPARAEDETLDPEWFPVRALTHESAKPRFWLIARPGRVVSVRQGQRMRSLRETRRVHESEARARAQFDRRVADKLEAGYRDLAGDDLEDAILHHEPLIREMDRALVRRAARGLLATDSWGHTLSAQALVRALVESGDPADRDLARALVARIAAFASRSFDAP